MKLASTKGNYVYKREGVTTSIDDYYVYQRLLRLPMITTSIKDYYIYQRFKGITTSTNDYYVYNK